MPKEIQQVPVTFASTGIVVKSSPDEIPITAYKAMVNVYTDRENVLTVRPGFTRLNSGLPSAPYSLYIAKDIADRLWRFAIAGRRLYVAPVVNPNDDTIWPLALGTGFAPASGSDDMSDADDPRGIWETFPLTGTTTRNYVFVADGTVFLKHPGGWSEATRIGIPRPPPLLSVVAAGAGALTGTDYQYCYTYYDSVTGTESDRSDIYEAPTPVVNGSYTITFPSAPGIVPPLPSPDTVRLYRLGGTNDAFHIVAEMGYTPAGPSWTWTDDIGDLYVGAELSTDNQLPPDGVKGVIAYDNRLWTWGGSVTTDDGDVVPEPSNQLRFSKGTRVESFPATNTVLVGSGADEIRNCIEYDGELFVFTTLGVWRITGSEGSYRAVATAINQGLASVHGVCKGTHSVYMHAFDGIYEFPSGRKISEVINPIFFRQTVNQMSYIPAGREYLCDMQFWNNRVYFTYPGTDLDEYGNDKVLIWDVIYERWHWYIYGAQCLFTERHTNILTAGNVIQYAGFDEFGNPSGVHTGGAYPIQLENGFYDQCAEGNQGIFWVIDTREFDLGMPDQEKRFIDFVVDADTQDEPIRLEAAFDLKEDDMDSASIPWDQVGDVHTMGRQRVILPVMVGDGDSRFATRIALRLMAWTKADATAFTKIYKIVHRFIPEPPRHGIFVTDWSDYGTPGPKYFRELWVEMDTFNTPLDSIEVQIDQAVAQVLDTIPPCDGQTKLYFGLTPDIRGTLARLKFIPHGQAEVKVYDHNFQVMAEPPQINTVQTPWTDEAWPYPKLWKEVLLDIDTANMPLEFNFWVDGVIKETFDVQADGRRRITHSLPQDVIGKLARLTLDEAYWDPLCCLPQGVRIYGVNYVIDKEPADVTFADSYDYLWSFDRLKLLRRFWVSMKNPDCDVTMEIYIDETLVSTKTITASTATTGFTKRRIDLESAMKGRLLRIIFSGVFSFQIYWERSEWEIKDLNSEDGYRRERMTPPQTQ